MVAIIRSVVAIGLAAWLARRGTKQGSLSAGGAAAAFLTGVLHLALGWTFGAVLILFYATSSKLTKVRQQAKAKLDASFKLNGQRGTRQVLSNSVGGGVAAAVACAAPLLLPGSRAQLVQLMAWCAFLGHYSCCCGDTWASEVGMLSLTPPRLITSLKQVPAGVNGAVSTQGLAASAAGGAFVGLVLWVVGCISGELGAVAPVLNHVLQQRMQQGLLVELVPAAAQQGTVWVMLGLAAGLGGALVDSLLGATLQYTGMDMNTRKVVSKPATTVKHISGLSCLSNDAVNAIAAMITSLSYAGLAYTTAAAIWL